MTIGIGVDLVDVKRIEASLDRIGERFAKRVLSNQELVDYEASTTKVNFVAKRFAVKEAVAKALGTGFSQGVSWRDISLTHDENGRPTAILRGGAEAQMLKMGGEKALVSISDEAGLVIAYAHIV